MRNFKRLMMAVCVLFFLMLIIGNLYIVKTVGVSEGRPYMVEVSRVVDEIENGTEISQLDLDKYDYVTDIILCKDDSQLVKNSSNDYCIKAVGDDLYRVEYKNLIKNTYEKNMWFTIIFVISFSIIMAVLVYVYRLIIVPFNKLERVPYELSKGNLTTELTENKSKYFGKFVWGTNLLRESIETRREKELNMHREKKVLLLSLAHDIKTPLSVIRLNAQALEKGLYKDEAKQKEVAGLVVDKTDEIEKYVTEIISASKDDFLELSVKNGEVYLSEIIDEIKRHYSSKLERLKTDFVIENYNDCLLYGDRNRLIEVVQNLMENAIKYGDKKSIAIGFEREEDCCLLSVRNSGETVRTDELIHLFDSFFRGSNAKKEKGSGLGLYICRNLMNKMDGDIFVKQQEDNFVVTVVIKMI